MKKHLIISMSIIFAILNIASDGICFKKEVKFGDWIGIVKNDPMTDKISRSIATFSKDGICSLWLTTSGLVGGTMMLILQSKKIIENEYLMYRVDKNDPEEIETASRGCKFYCLREYVTEIGGIVDDMKKGDQIMFKYFLYPNGSHHPTFSLEGFTAAVNWLEGQQ